MTTPLENLPEVKAFASTSEAGGIVRLGGAMYFQLPEGVSTISISTKTTGMTIYLASGRSASGRYFSAAVAEGETRVIPGVAVPRGESRFLNLRAGGVGHDVGVTIITYPL